MKTENTYNGWTNYATWKINLEYRLNDNAEIFESHTDIGCIADECQSMVEESLKLDCNNSNTLSYAMDFIDDVNWYEIAEHIAESLNIK